MGEWNLTEASEYVTYNAVDNEDFLAADETNKLRFLNVAQRTLHAKYRGFTIPVEATYLFACALNANFNDTTVMAQRGIAGFSLSGISFTFKDWAKKELGELIPAEVAEMIEEANGGAGGGSSRVKAWVL